MKRADFRTRIVQYVRQQAKPADKLSHQPRLYELACRLAGKTGFDADVLFAAAWLHDLGVFIGHRPEDPRKLARWDHLAYVLKRAPGLLKKLGFPIHKIPAVLEVIRTHMPSSIPTSYEGILLRDADILEQLGAVGILRTVSKVGRDTRFVVFSDALAVLRRNLKQLPRRLRLPAAKRLAKPKLRALRSFMQAADAEAHDIDW